MIQVSPATAFADIDIHRRLEAMSDPEIDGADFGVIGFDAAGTVRRYNRFESECAGLAPQRVLGQSLFTSVAPCMNNFMVAQRFEDATAGGTALDETINYVLTLRMRPVKVKLRLLSLPDLPTRYVLVQRAL